MFRAGLAALLSLMAMPAEASPPDLAIYGQLPGIEQVAISPSGQHIAVVARVGGGRRLLILDAAMKLVKVVGVDRLKVRDLNWAGDSAVLVDYGKTVDLAFNFTTNKAELDMVIVVPLDDAKPWQIFDKQRQSTTAEVDGTYGIIQRDGRWYGYFGGITLLGTEVTGGTYLPSGKQRPDLYEVDLQTQKARPIARRPDGDGLDRDWLVDGTGAVGASLDFVRSTGEWTLRNARHEKLAGGVNADKEVWLVGFTPDGTGVIWGQSDKMGDARHWFSVPLAGGAAAPYLDDQRPVRHFEDRGHRLTGYVDDSDTLDGHFFDPLTQKIYRATQRAFPEKRMEVMGHSDSFDRLLVATEGPGDPHTFWYVDIHTGKAAVLGQAYPMDATDVGPMKMVPYVAADGLKMEGVLTLPPAGALPGREAKMLPAVILPHGGPYGYHDLASFDWLAQAFASRGYAVFQPNFRGSGGYGADFQMAGYGEWGRKMQTDISDGLAALVSQGIVDPARVCIMGASYGGYAALAGVTVQQGIYRCAVSYAGISDVGAWVDNHDTASDGDPLVMRRLRQEVGDGQDMKAVSPIRFASAVTVPVLLIHGKDDTVVDFSQSSRMASALRDAGKNVQMVTLPGEDHWLSNSETRLSMLQAALDFMMKYNPPDGAK